jgi:hypothetical protein
MQCGARLRTSRSRPPRQMAGPAGAFRRRRARADRQRPGTAPHQPGTLGLPTCKAGSYRQMLLNDLHLAASARELAGWLAAADPTSRESASAAEAALPIIEFASERGEWTAMARLARAAEAVLFITGRWEAWYYALAEGLRAAQATGDKAAEAFLSHQLGSLALCQDQLGDAVRLLHHALALREQIGDRAGAASPGTTCNCLSRLLPRSRRGRRDRSAHPACPPAQTAAASHAATAATCHTGPRPPRSGNRPAPPARPGTGTPPKPADPRRAHRQPAPAGPEDQRSCHASGMSTERTVKHVLRPHTDRRLTPFKGCINGVRRCSD